MIEIALTILGVTVPSALIVLAVRRWFDPVSWPIAALLLAIVFAFTARGVFTSGMPVPLDEVMRGYPYRGIFGVEKSKNYLTNDTVKQILPWMHVVREQFARGRAPVWDPYLFSGYPLLGNGQSAPFSPFFLLTLFVPLPKQIVAMAGLKLFVALLFGYLLIRREGAGHAASVFGSLLFAFAIFNNAFLYYPMTAVTLLLPAAAYAILLCLRRRSGAPVVLVAIVVASLLAGGHPESVFHVAIAVLALVLIDFISERFSFGDFVRVAVAAILGLLIAAPAWVPVLEQARVSLRVMSIKTMNTGGPFPATTLWAMLNPDGFGNPAHGNYGWIMSYTHVASVYIGLIAAVLFPAGLLSPRATTRDRLLAAAAIIFFLVSLHWTPLASLAYAVPPFSWIAHDRLRFVVCFFAGIVAARSVSRFKNWDVALSLVSTAIALPLAIYVFMKMYGITLTPISAVGMACIVLFWIGVLIKREWAAGLACVLTGVELFVFTFDYNAMTDRRYYAPRLPIIDALHRFAAIAPSEPFRVLGLDWVLLPNAAAQYGLEDLRGSDPMEWSDYVRFFRVAEVKDTSIDVKRIADPAHIAIDFLNVRYLLTEPHANLGGKWMRLYSGVDGELYENRNFIARFFVPHLARRVRKSDWERELVASADFQETPLVYGRDLPPVVVNPGEATVTCRTYGPAEFRLRVVVPQRALVASSQPAMRWWEVKVNGKLVQPLRVNGAFLSFFVPAGVSDVSVKYRPLPFRVSVGVAFLAAVGLAGYARRLQNRGIAA
ncbi:MAG TPA: YfhO family protein [Thermoanaerobaculia bacterium]|nr:YfhO family protein [Thermoanaerobaculia bacterium]